MKLPFQEAAQLEAQGTPFVIVTLIATRGHAPQDVGAKAIITNDGLFAGTVGGGKVEAKCIQLAQEMLAEAGATAPQTHHWNLQRDVGMSCGGETTYLFEKIVPASWRIVVFGAGHVAQKLVRILRMLDCRVTVIDSRPEWTSKLPRAPHLDVQLMEEPKEYVEKLKYSEPKTRPYFVIMTRGHATDVPVLREVLKHYPDSPYFGVIGSNVKGIKIRNEMKAEGFNADLVAKIKSPMGLDLGNNDPAEIAISIVAELIQVRGRS